MKTASRCCALWVALAVILSFVSLPALADDSSNSTSTGVIVSDPTTSLPIEPTSEAYYNGHHYALYDVGLIWADAKEFCERLGGYLVCITSSAEQNIVNQLLNSGTRNNYWLGGYNSGSWKWVSGETFSYTNWCRYQPDNFTGTENRLHAYRAINPNDRLSTLGSWNDLDADGTCQTEDFFGTDNFGLICEWDTLSTVGEDQYLISVVDENGNPLEGASVTFDSKTKTTDEAGLAFFDAFTYQTPVIEVTLDGYLGWSNQDSNWEKNAARFETVILYPESVGTLKLSSARYSNASDMSHSTNLLTTTKKVSLGSTADLTGNLDFGNFYLKCSARDKAQVKTYQLWQGSSKIAESASGAFSLNTASFSKGGDCFILVLGNDGNSVKTAINLEFVLAPINKETSIDLSGTSISFSVGDDVPFLGGSTFDLSLPVQIPLTVYASENKVKIGFNVNLAGGDSEEEQLEATKKLCSELKRLGGLKLGKLTGPQSRKYRSLIKDTNKWKFFKGGEINFLGYAEGDWGSSKATGALILQLKIDPLSYDFNTWCVVVPLTVQVKLSLDGSFAVEVSYDFDTETLDGGFDFAASAKLNAFGGVGVSKLVGAGAYGSATLDGDFSILPKATVNSVDLTGELGLKAYLGWLTYERAFAHNTWHLYTRNNTRSATLGAEAGAEDLSVDDIQLALYRQLNSGMYDASQYRKADLSYLDQERDLMGNSGAEVSAKVKSVDLRTSFSALIQNTYRNAQPVMVSSGDALYAAFLRADASSNRVYTVVSKYDGVEWKSTVATASDDQLDGTPALLADPNGNIWLAYTRTGSGFNGDSLLSYAQNQEIVVGRIDPDTLAFTHCRTYGNMGYSHMQQFSLVNGQPTLVWLSSATGSDNDVLWPQENAIYKAVCSAASWGAPQLVQSLNNVVSEIAVGEENGELAIACVMDDDNRSDTMDDRNLYRITADGRTLLCEGGYGVSFDSMPGSDGAAFIWIEDGVLRDANGTELTLESINGQYRVNGDCIYYSIETETGAELCVARYENGAWGLPITLTDGEGYLENICIGTLNGSDYVLGLYTSVSIGEDNIEDSKDLVWTTVTAVSDIRITGLDYDTENLVAGEAVPVTLELINAGDHVVDSIDVYLDDAIVSTASLSLAPGQSGEITVSVTCPNAVESHSISILETSRADYHPEDNRILFSIGYPDLAVKLQCNQIGARTTVYAIVSNEGVGSASGKLYFTDAQGEVLASKGFYNARPGSSIITAMDFDWNSVSDNSTDICAVLECQQEDLNDYNNSDTIHLIYSGHRKLANPDFVLPAALTSIQDEAFASARFRAVKLPDGLKKIGPGAFRNCARLEQIEIPASVVSIADDAFEGTGGFVIYCPEGSYAGEYAAQHEITCIYE